MSEFHDMAPRYGGRVVKIEVWVNTDEEHEKVSRRVRNAARGQKPSPGSPRPGTIPPNRNRKDLS